MNRYFARSNVDMRGLEHTFGGRANLRSRVAVEHALAHIAARKDTLWKLCSSRASTPAARRFLSEGRAPDVLELLALPAHRVTSSPDRVAEELSTTTRTIQRWDGDIRAKLVRAVARECTET